MMPVPQSTSRMSFGSERGAWTIWPCISSLRPAAWSERRMCSVSLVEGLDVEGRGEMKGHGCTYRCERKFADGGSFDVL